MKKFSTNFYGYSKQEVNAFVHDVAKEYESMLNNLKARDAEITSLKQKLVEYQGMENTLNKAIVLAEDTSIQIKKMARDESQRVIEEAKRNASRIVNEALLKAEKLEQDGENLRQRIAIFKRRFKAILETELDAIKQIDDEY